MNRNLYSNIEFTELKERINQEILRRGTYKYWDPLTVPSVGTDRTPPLSTPEEGVMVQITEKTYTINNSSEGSIEPTRNINYPAHGENPAGQNPNPNPKVNVPNTSAAEMNLDEMKNLLVGLAKIQDINLFYGRDETEYLAFRDPQGIEDAVNAAENSELNALLHESDISPTKNDPNNGVTDQQDANYPNNIHSVTYPMENGLYVMPSGESDGEEVKLFKGLGPENFYDDYGAEPGDVNYHPMNRFISEQVRRDWHDQDHNRNDVHTFRVEGGKPSTRFGPNPRNPEKGDDYRSRPVYGGKEGSCNSQCTGLCYVTCDNECSESCTTTCWNRCGESCTSSCGNVCTGCSTLCYTSCKTKCENVTGYSCMKAGAKTVKITTTGGRRGEPASNTLEFTTHTCQGCSYSCQFYPNKKTECWDAGCMGKCFISCSSSCSTSCYGGCIDNDSTLGATFKSGKGRGCSAGCTLNCIGFCSGVCAGYCIQTCWHTCKGSCSDNCTWTCVTACGDGCMTGCTNGCTGCSNTCESSCKDVNMARACSGCGMEGGCSTTCMFDCNRNCMGNGCRSICGIEAAGACEANCRLNCMATSCTALCSDACSSQCTTCVNTCGFQCGMCSGLCSTGCEAACNINCSQDCSNSCSDNCVHSCSEECGACSSLCFSCVGMCIGICSVKCENGCSSCANMCGWWCDSSCNRTCLSECSTFCINTCSGSCATYLTSNTTNTAGPARDPIAEGYIYPHPQNRWEERESFKLIQSIAPYQKPEKQYNSQIVVTMISNKFYAIVEMNIGKIVENIQRVRYCSEREGMLITNISNIDVSEIEHIWKFGNGEYTEVHLRHLFVGDFVYLYDTSSGPFDHNDVSYLTTDRNLIITGPTELKYLIMQTSISGGVYDVNETTGAITINEDMLPSTIECTTVNADGGGGIFVIKFFKDDSLFKSIDDIEFILPFGFTIVGDVFDKNGNLIVIIKRDQFLYPESR